jgi:hypothetical protein
MSGHEQDTDIRDSTPNSTGPSRAAGGMGVSSERVGHTGPGQWATDGVKDTSAVDDDLPDAEVESGAETGDLSVLDDTDRRLRRSGEVKPEGLPPAAGYPSLDPRSEDKPYKDAKP